MNITFKTDSKRRLVITAIASLLAVAACSDSKTTAPQTSENGASYEIANDHAIGNPNAKVTVAEYASVTCGHCANFHEAVYGDLKQKYIDTGLVRFIFREFPTAPQNIADAGFLLANCASDDRFFDVISLQFKRQQQIISNPRQELVKIARSAGMSEADFETCLLDEDIRAAYEAKIQYGEDAGVTGTPSFEINGEMVKRTASGKPLYTLETWDEVLAPLLGEDAPEPTTSATEDAPE